MMALSCRKSTMDNLIQPFAFLLILATLTNNVLSVFAIQSVTSSNHDQYHPSVAYKSSFSARYRSPAALAAHRTRRSVDCTEKADISENTIIRTKDSRVLGAKFLNETSLGPGQRERCLSSCCLTPGCNVAVYDERNDGNCYLFDCGSPSDFRCKFTPHSHYTSAVWSTPSVQVPEENLQLDLTEVKHEEELSQLKHAPANFIPVFPKLLPTTMPPSTTAAKPKCSHYQFQCRFSGECIAIYNACDGIPQCADGSDEAVELGCPSTTTQAPTTTLVLPTKTVYNNPELRSNNNEGDNWNRYEYERKLAERPHHFSETDSHHPIFKENYNDLKPVGNPMPFNKNSDNKNEWYVQGVSPELLRSNPNLANVPYDKNSANYPYNTWRNNWDSHYHPKGKPDAGLYPTENENYRQGNVNFNQDLSYNNYHEGPVAGPPARSHYNSYEQANIPAFNPDNFRPQSPVQHGRPDVVYEPAAGYPRGHDNGPSLRGESSKLPVMLQDATIPPQFTTLTPPSTTWLPTSTISSTSTQGASSATSIQLITVGKKTHQAHAQVHKFHVSEADYQSQKQEQARQTAGAIWALTLGLAVTAALIVLVGCRMRVLKRHLRRGRGAHRDADFLVNGMYL